MDAMVRRRTSMLLPIASMLLCAGVGAMWVRSYWCSDGVQVWGRPSGNKESRRVLVWTAPGGVIVVREPIRYPSSGIRWWFTWGQPSPEETLYFEPALTQRRFGGF